ncbi:uncharacterized protein [Panulirus ornatus]|uniref:uncharacterized protein isoform X3 n=1 Tax=Panulirus ornatus TaxID=150431 RepID=UPI003A868504
MCRPEIGMAPLFRRPWWLLLLLIVAATVLIYRSEVSYNYIKELRHSLNSFPPLRSTLAQQQPAESNKSTTISEGCESSCQVVGLESIEQYRAYLHHTETACKNMRQFGGKKPAPGDGRKFVCMDKRFNIKKGDCVIFSFGVNNEWSFEDDFDKFGCKVYAFDPTMGVEDHQRSPNIHFSAVGIANYQGVKNIGMGKNWAMRKVDRFENLVNQAGLAGKEIDVVKLDVELSEVDFLQDMLLNSPHVLKKIKQIAMEVHDDHFKGDLSQTSRQQVFWPYFMLLKCQGFKLIQSRDAGRWREVVWAREVAW